MLRQRKPMNRGKGFQRKQVAARPAAGIEAACGLQPDEEPIDHHQVATLKPLRGGTYASPDVRIRISPKPEAHRNPHLLAMARGKPCLFRIPGGVCNFDRETTVAAHSNWAMHGKGGARKANDEYSAWCCSSCHSWLDQGKADKGTKELAFMAAHLAQVCEWRAIAGSASAPIADRLAAQWALDHLNATPVGALRHTMNTALTEKQAAVLAFMREFLAANDGMPTDRTIANHFGWASTNSAFEQLRALEKKGCIERNAQGGWRFVRSAPKATP